MKLKSPRGTTLIEVLVSTAIMVFIFGGLFTLLAASNVSWQTTDALVRSQQEARKAIDILRRDLRVAENIALTQTTNDVNLSFSRLDIGNVSYVWSTSGANANQMIRQALGVSTIVAQSISAFSVNNQPSDISVSVSSTVDAGHAQDPGSFQLVGKVAKR